MGLVSPHGRGVFGWLRDHVDAQLCETVSGSADSPCPAPEGFGV